VKHLPRLPVERALKVISGRWKPQILHLLLAGPKRLSELERLIPGISQKVLIQQLRELEAHGVITRHAFAEAPPRVEYAAAPLAEALRPLLGSLCEWGLRHARHLGDLQMDPKCPGARDSPGDCRLGANAHSNVKTC
jgi:DNA-binding HxlR family transcriptional regulator